MKVKELIKKLSKFDGELEVYTSITDTTDYIMVSNLKSSEVRKRKKFGCDNFEGFEHLIDDEGNWIGKDVVMIELFN
jgi:hypothetical protein